MGGSPAQRTRPLTTPKHIVVIPSWYSAEGRGSGGGYFRDQALALQAAGHRIAMLVPDIHTRRDRRTGRATPSIGQINFEHDGIDIYRMTRGVVMPRLPYRNALSWSLCGLDLFRTYVARNGLPDLVHAHSCLNAGVLAVLIARRHGVPFVLTEHSTAFDQDRLRWWEHALVRRVSRHAAGRFAVSPHLAALLERRYPGTVWTYLPNILGEDFLRPSRQSIRQVAAAFTFIAAARMAPVKNHALLINAFADAFAADPDTRLVLAGDGPLRPELTRLCVERGIAGQVEFRGTLSSDELRTAMDTADSFVLTSDVETFGVVVIEAQAAALPCIVTASGGPDHLIDASNGLLVPVGDVRMLRAALIDMRNTAARYDRAAIRAFAIDRYGAETFAKQFDRLTADVM